MGLKISRKKGADEDVLLEIAEATTSKAGLLSAGDKKKLDGIKTGAEANQNAFGKVVVDEVTISASAGGKQCDADGRPEKQKADHSVEKYDVYGRIRRAQSGRNRLRRHFRQICERRPCASCADIRFG